MESGAPIFVYPSHYPNLAFPGKLSVISASQLSAAVTFASKPPWMDTSKGAFVHPDGLALLLTRDTPVEFWRDLVRPEDRYGVTEQRI